MTLKKALVAITVVAMLFGMVGTAFAATSFPDVTDSKTAAAATRLNALKIVTGYPDGNFGVGDSVTRAQFAAIAVRALGLDSAATYAKGATKFSDVSADYWASGYVNIATQQGIIAGYPDGKFGPDDKVTYAQALTMVVRMLGYAPIVEGRGTWPANYIAKAAQIGFTNGVAFNGNDNAIRGNIALFVDSALTKPMMVEDGIVAGQPSYKVDATKTLLGTTLGAQTVSGTLVTSPDLFSVTDNTVTVDDHDPATTDNPILLNGASYAGLLGHEVKAWYTSDGVFLIEDKTVASNVVSATLTSVAAGVEAATNDDNGKTIALTGVAANNWVKNGVVNTKGVATDSVTVVYKDGAPYYVLETNYSSDVVKSVSAAFQSITLQNAAAISLANSSASVISGDAAKLEDIKANDVVQWITNGSDFRIIVTRNAKTGSLTKATSAKFYLDGTGYGSALANGKTPNDYASSLGKSVTLYLDKDGYAVGILSSVAAATANYGVVYGKYNGQSDTGAVDPVTGQLAYYVRLIQSDGSVKTFLLDDGAAVKVYTAPATSTAYTFDVTVDGSTADNGSINTAIANALTANSRILGTYALTSDGSKISSLTLYTGTSVVSDTWTADDVNHTVTGAVYTYAVPASTPIFQDNGVAPNNVRKAITRTQMEAASTSFAGLAVLDGSVVKELVVTDNTFTTAANNVWGIVSAKYQTADGYFVSIISKGTTTDYKISLTAYGDSNLVAKKVVKFGYDGTSLISYQAQSALGAALAAGQARRVTAIDTANGTLTTQVFDINTGAAVGSAENWVLASGAQAFNIHSGAAVAADLSNVAEGASVAVYGSGVVSAIVIQ